MYKPLGLCLNDFDLSYNQQTGLYELIHLQGPPISTDRYDATVLETTYGFATSKDLVNWEAHPQVFGIHDVDNVFDNSAIWTMKTVHSKDGERFMFYTGVCYETYFYQAIGLARFDAEKLIWQRISDRPVISADPRRYQTTGAMAWRDPYVVYDEELGQYTMFIAARDNKFEVPFNGCIATASSTNMKDWTINDPLISPGQYTEMECPVYLHRGDYHYILVSISDTRQIHVFRSDEIYGEYVEIEPLLEPYCYAPRVIAYQGRDVLLHTQWIERRNDVGQMVWSRGYLADPKELHQDENGGLYVTPMT